MFFDTLLMALEIERKFLVKNDEWKRYVTHSITMLQGYLNEDETSSIRVRIEGDKAFLNIKSATIGIVRQEFEYPIPYADAQQLLHTLCRKPLVEKTRYYHDDGSGFIWEIDVFAGENTGLIVAEIELEDTSTNIQLPDWVSTEVSNDPRYYNVNLVQQPFQTWLDQ